MADHVDLGPRLEKVVGGLVDAGLFKSRADVLRAGVRLIEEREEMIGTLSAAIARGEADAEAGRVKSSDEVLARLSRKYLNRSTAAADE